MSGQRDYVEAEPTAPEAPERAPARSPGVTALAAIVGNRAMAGLARQQIPAAPAGKPTVTLANWFLPEAQGGLPRAQRPAGQEITTDIKGKAGENALTTANATVPGAGTLDAAQQAVIATIRANRQRIDVSSVHDVTYAAGGTHGLQDQRGGGKDADPNALAQKPGETPTREMEVLRAIWEDMKSEGGSSSIQGYDAQRVTWGRGFGAASFHKGGTDSGMVGQILDEIFKDVTARQYLLDRGVAVEGGSMLLVNTAAADAAGAASAAVEKGPNATALMQGNPQLMAILRDFASPGAAGHQVVADAMWTTVRRHAAAIPAEAYSWPIPLLVATVHLGHWGSGYGWEGNKAALLASAGAPLEVLRAWAKRAQADESAGPVVVTHADWHHPNNFRKWGGGVLFDLIVSQGTLQDMPTATKEQVTALKGRADLAGKIVLNIGDGKAWVVPGIGAAATRTGTVEEQMKSDKRRRWCFMLNGMSMTGMLDAMKAMAPDELTDLRSPAARTDVEQARWHHPRLRFAMEVVATGTMPGSPPTDLTSTPQKTGQLDEATAWLARHTPKTAPVARLARDVTDKHGDASGTMNAGPTEVFGCRRVPLQGLTSTTPDASMKDRDGKTDVPTTESAAGKAVAVLPNALLHSFRDAASGPPGPVDLLVYLHGMNIGMRERKGSEPLNARDANVDLVEAQLNIVSSTGRRIMGLMPQGTTTAGFGGKGGFSPDAFVREAMGALVALKHLPEMPPIGRFILAGHSGGGNEMAGEIDVDPTKSRLPSQFAPGAAGGSPNVEMLTFDGINQDGQEDKHIAWIKQMAGLDATAMTAMPDNHARLEYLGHSARWVGFCTNSTYTPRYLKVQAAIAETLGPKGAGKDVASEVLDRWRQNYRVELPKGDQSNDHNLLVGEKLAEGLETGEGAKSMHRRRAYFSANGRNLPGMLNFFDGYKKRGELDDLAGEQAQNDLRQPMWNWPRIQFAMDAVAERRLPSVVPDDVRQTGQVDEATDWLKTHGGKAPEGAAARLARAVLARDPVVDGIDLGPLYAARGIDIAKLKAKMKTVTFLGKGVTVNSDLVAPLKAVETRITSASAKHTQSISSIGGFNMRTRRGSTTALSDHAFGRAIDINSATNVMFRQQISPPNTGTADAPKRDFDASAGALARVIQAVTAYGTFPPAPEKAADGTVDPVAQARYEKEKELFASGANVTALSDAASLRAASEMFRRSFYDAWPGEIKTAVGTRKKELEAARTSKATTVAYLEDIVKGLSALAADIDAVGGAGVLKQVAKTGFMDLEEYVVDAFISEGFRWGGQWGGASRDFMHFEYGSTDSDR